MKVLVLLVLDVVALAGLAGFVFGVYQLSPPAAWIVGGLTVAGAAGAAARKAAR